jgi:hypothetical protein
MAYVAQTASKGLVKRTLGARWPIFACKSPFGYLEDVVAKNRFSARIKLVDSERRDATGIKKSIKQFG